MAIDAKKILKRLQDKKNDRGKHTLYLSKSLFREFSSNCGEYSASVVIEELMKEFNSTATKLKKK